MPRSYHWSIATKQFRKRSWSSLRLSLCFALCTFLAAAALSTYTVLHTKHLEHTQSATISLFLKEDMDEISARDFASDLAKDAMIASIDVQTPDSLRSYFQDRYGVNVAEVLPQNPFVTILRLHIKPEFLSSDLFMQMVQQYRAMPTMVEEVSYQSDYVRAVIQESTVLWWTSLVGGLLVFVVICTLIAFALRAESLYLSDDQRVVSLLGSRSGFLARSSLWRNLLCALPGIALGAGLSYTVLLMSQSSGLIRGELVQLQAIGVAAILVLILSMVWNRRSLHSN